MIHQLSSGSGGRKQVDRTCLPFGDHSVQRFDDELRTVSFEKDISSLSTGQVNYIPRASSLDQKAKE